MAGGGTGGREIGPESEALVSPENLGRKPVRLAQEEGGMAGESSGLGRVFGSDMMIVIAFEWWWLDLGLG